MVSGERLKTCVNFHELWEGQKGFNHNENNNNYYNLVRNSEMDDEVKDNLFEEKVDDEIKVSPKDHAQSNSGMIDKKFAHFV